MKQDNCAAPQGRAQVPRPGWQSEAGAAERLGQEAAGRTGAATAAGGAAQAEGVAAEELRPAEGERRQDILVCMR